jgi:hypothetical protein
MRPILASSAVRRAVLAALLVGVGVCAACGSKPPPAPAATRPAAAAPRPTPSARSTLASYLDLTFSGRHGRAWSLLTAGDHQSLSRATYVRQEEANDRVRAQARALGPIRHRIASIRERGGRAEAVVTVSTGFGTQQVRFVLRRERERWRVDYNDSWAE